MKSLVLKRARPTRPLRNSLFITLILPILILPFQGCCRIDQEAVKAPQESHNRLASVDVESSVAD